MNSADSCSDTIHDRENYILHLTDKGSWVLGNNTLGE